MIRLRKYGGIAILLLAVILGIQAGVSLLVRTHRMRGYLIARLESAFGRPVQAGRFSVQVLPIPELEVDAITIGEDPAFGNEYFLRAERMTARFRWLGLLRGHFEFGAMSFTRPSLILVRNAGGRWNLEGWLPPARPAFSLGSLPRPLKAQSPSTHLLEKIEFDQGRINFKTGDEKRPFAFNDVSGNVEQVSSGRWQLQLQATPWRSGVALQSTGTVEVAGYVAGTSARLQPAQIRVHWEKVSLADLFRLITGNDSGVRGELAMDGNASIGMGTVMPEVPSSEWRFVLQARARNIHRWNLTERSDNPRVNVSVKGIWEFAANQVRAEEVRVELPQSRMVGGAAFETSRPAHWKVAFPVMAFEGEDLLAWSRAFQLNVSEDLALREFISGSLTLSGWPLRWESGSIESTPGTLRLRNQVLARLDAFHGWLRNGVLNTDALHLRLPGESPSQPVKEKAAAKTRPNSTPENELEAVLTQDTFGRLGALRLNARLADVTPLFELTAAFGFPINKGWEYRGAASGSLAWNWGRNPKEARRSGSLELSKAHLQVAGLNEPLKIDEARLEWKDGARSATLAKLDAFGSAWSGAISESTDGIASDDGNWRFQLHADHIDATELDRWVGPRSRPNWLQRLLPSLLGSSTAQASELLRRVSAEGQLTADLLTIERIKLTKVRAFLALRGLQLDVRDVEAQWSGGSVQGGMQASFSPLPNYQVDAQIENVNLTELPWPPRWGERWSGLASGKIRLSTNGVGREELLKGLAGGGALKLSKIEFRGWDVEESTQSGGPSTGASRWTSGEGEFQLSDQQVHLDGFRLEAPRQRTQLAGTISFGMDGNLVFTPKPRVAPGARTASQSRELRVSGQLENPEVAVFPTKTEQARP